MIKDFQNESAKPVNITPVPPPFPDEATYQADITARSMLIYEKLRNIETRQLKIQISQDDIIDQRNEKYTI